MIHDNIFIFNTPLTINCNPALLDFLRGMDSHYRNKDRMLKVYTHCHDMMFQRDNNNPQHRMKGLFLLLHTVYSYLIHRLCTPFLHHTQLLQVASNIGNRVCINEYLQQKFFCLQSPGTASSSLQVLT